MKRRFLPGRRSSWPFVIGILVIVLLNGVLQPVTVVVAKVPIAPGTPLTADLLELRTIPIQAKPGDAFSSVADLQDKVVAVGRAAGDYITASVLGNSAEAGLPASLAPGPPGGGGQGRSGQRHGRSAARGPEGDPDRDALPGRAAEHPGCAGGARAGSAGHPGSGCNTFGARRHPPPPPPRPPRWRP